MNHLKIFLFLLVRVVISCIKLKKDEEFELDDFYFRCKIDGRTYVPNSWANCLTFMIIEDTSLIASANRGFETIRFGINDSTDIHVWNYTLMNIGGMRVRIKIVLPLLINYRTQNFNPGILLITEMTKQIKRFAEFFIL